MSDFNREEFRKEIKMRLEALDNRRLSAAFAVRMALLVLPFLAERSEEKGFLWYWQADERERHLLTTCRISQVVFFEIFDFFDADAGVTTASIFYVYTAYTASATYAAYAASASASAASAVSVAASAYAASSAASAASVYADAAAASSSSDLIIHIRQELDHLKTRLDVIAYLTSKISLPPIFSSLKETFLSQLRKLPEFDYWAEWLQDRYDGKPIDVKLLRKSVLLPQEISTQNPREINRYLKQLRDGVLQEEMKRVRAIFIGNGDAGKTSIIQALNNKKVIEGGTDMTPGIEISEW